ncbi:MAG: hypothetical protein A2076_06645 [Geobacteraceae bacterium GWC2_53_11]|nr:MAG: hypothetical protein A2076_06645 [Geobacteraceae bacterium GWC2_53_11]
MGYTAYNHAKIEGDATEQKRFINEVISCRNTDDWHNLSALIPTDLGEEHKNVSWSVHSVIIRWTSECIDMHCLTKNSRFDKAMFCISKHFPKLLFSLLMNEKMYGGYDVTTVFNNGEELINESHSADSVHSFFDRKGQVVNPGYLVETADGHQYTYKRRNMVHGPNYDSRGEDDEKITLILVDVYGNRSIKKMCDVKRVNSWSGNLEALKQQLLKDE